MISVVVPTYNSAVSLVACVNALLEQDYAGIFEIIVSDDGSTDGTADIVYQLFATQNIVRYFWHDNVQRAKNRNIGASEARGSVIVFLDADMLPISAFLSNHVAALKKLGNQGVVCGAIPIAERCTNNSFERYMSAKWNRRLRQLDETPSDPFLMQSGNFSIGKDFFEEIGGFEESFSHYGGEDIEFFIRAKKMGAVFGYSENALAHQMTCDNLAEFSNKYVQARIAMARVLWLHPDYAPPSIFQSAAKRSLIDALWNLWSNWPPSRSIMLILLPLIERLPDRYAFLIFDTLISQLRRASRW